MVLLLEQLCSRLRLLPYTACSYVRNADAAATAGALPGISPEPPRVALKRRGRAPAENNMLRMLKLIVKVMFI